MPEPSGNLKPDEPAARPARAPSGRRLDYDVIEPVGWRVVIRKDDNRRETKSGIVLPDNKEIPVITGRIVALSREVEHDEDITLRVYDKVLFDLREAIPVELEHDNRLFVVNVDHVLAVFRRTKPSAAEGGEADEADSDSAAES